MICFLACEALKFGKPRYLANLLILQNTQLDMGLRTSDDPYLDEPRSTSERQFSERAFHIFYLTFNRLLVSLRRSDSIDVSKSKLKTLMFTKAFDLSDHALNESHRL